MNSPYVPGRDKNRGEKHTVSAETPIYGKGGLLTFKGLHISTQKDGYRPRASTTSARARWAKFRKPQFHFKHRVSLFNGHCTIKISIQMDPSTANLYSNLLKRLNSSSDARSHRSSLKHIRRPHRSRRLYHHPRPKNRSPIHSNTPPTIPRVSRKNDPHIFCPSSKSRSYQFFLG